MGAGLPPRVSDRHLGALHTASERPVSCFFERVRVVVAWCEQRKDFRSFRSDRIRRWATLPAGAIRAAARVARA
jgi:hypothetical protein